MKKSMLNVISMVLIGALLVSNVPMEAANVDLQKVKELNERFNFIRNSYKEFKGASSAYDDCVQKHCKDEIDAMKKISDDMSKTTLADQDLRRILSNATTKAQDAFKACATTHCKDVQDRFNKSSRNYSLIIIGIIGVVLGTSLGLFARQVIKEEAESSVRLKEMQEAKEIALTKLLDKYNINDDEQARSVLYRYTGTHFDKAYLLRLTGPLLRAMAERRFNKRLSEADFDLFAKNFAYENQIEQDVLREILKKQEVIEFKLR